MTRVIEIRDHEGRLVEMREVAPDPLTALVAEMIHEYLPDVPTEGVAERILATPAGKRLVALEAAARDVREPDTADGWHAWWRLRQALDGIGGEP